MLSYDKECGCKCNESEPIVLSGDDLTLDNWRALKILDLSKLDADQLIGLRIDTRDNHAIEFEVEKDEDFIVDRSVDYKEFVYLLYNRTWNWSCDWSVKYLNVIYSNGKCCVYRTRNINNYLEKTLVDTKDFFKSLEEQCEERRKRY